jgi:hypothetical protein
VCLVVIAAFLLAGGCPMGGDDMGMPGDGNLIVNGTVFADAFSSNSPLLLQTGGETRIFVDDATGNVGIGSSSPQAMLHVKGGNIACDGRVHLLSEDDDFRLEITEGGISSYTGGSFSFATSQIPGGDALLHMRITSDGRVGIGELDPSERLHVVGNICATGTIAACSDARFKTNVKSLDRALNTIEKLRPVAYDWKRDEYPNHNFSDRRQIGLIAQELREVVPEAVQEGADGYLAVDYARLTPVLIQAIRELRNEKDAHIAELEARLSRLEAALADRIASASGADSRDN